MSKLRLILGLYAVTRAIHWPRLSWYFLRRFIFRAFHVRLGVEQLLVFKRFNAVASVTGQSGLVFLYEIVAKGVYDIEALEQKKASIRTVFDVGANCGFFVLRYASDYAAARFFCFEPHPQTFQALHKNITANRLGQRVTAIHAAVGAVSGECDIQISDESSMSVISSSPVQSLPTGKAVKVRVTSLDEFAERQNVWPDYLKIDVEGFETEVLKGAHACLQRANWVLLEYHSQELKHECEKLLGKSGFLCEPAGGALLFAQKKGAL